MGQRQAATPGWQPLLIGMQRPMTIGKADKASVAGEPLAVAEGLAVIRIGPEVDRQSHLGLVNRLNHLNDLSECGQKSTAGSRWCRNRLDRQTDASRSGYRSQLFERMQHQPAGMGKCVPTAAASVDHQRVSLELFSGIDGLTAVLNAFTKCAAVAAGKSTSPLEAGNLHACPLKEVAGFGHADIGKLRTPQRNGIETVLNAVAKLFRKFPTQGRQLADSKTQRGRCSHGGGISETWHVRNK